MHQYIYETQGEKNHWNCEKIYFWIILVTGDMSYLMNLKLVLPSSGCDCEHDLLVHILCLKWSRCFAASRT